MKNLLRKIFIIILFLSISYSIFSQDTGIITGRVEGQDGKPVDMVSIAVMGIPGGTITNKSGRYTLTVPANTFIKVMYSRLGYTSDSIFVNLKKGEKKEINKSIRSKDYILKEVGVEDMQSRRTGLIPIDPKTATVIPGPNEGIEAIIKTLPGVTSSNELSSQYSVRGGNFDENLVYVNDIEIYRPFLIRSGQQEGLSFVNPDLVSSVLFSAGGFEAKYGDKMSSVLDIRYKKPKEFGGSVSMSLLGGSAHLEGTAAKSRLSYIFGVRQKSNQYILKSMETKGDYKPSFSDAQTYISYDINQKLEIGFLGNYSRNHFNFIPQTRETKFGTIQQALRLKVFFEGQEVDAFDTWMGALALTYKPKDNLRLKFISSGFNTSESETFDILGQYWIDQLESDFGKESFGKVAFNKGVGGFLNHARNYLDASVYSLEHKGSYYTSFCQPLQWGVKYSHEIVNDRLNEWNLNDSADYSLPRQPDFPIDNVDPNGNITYKPYHAFKDLYMNDLVNTDINLTSNRVSVFIQNRWNLDGDSSEMSLTAGIRAEYWDVNKQFVTGPRATLSYKPHWKKDILLRSSAGYYYQPPFYRELRDFNGVLHKDMKAQTSIHFVEGMDWNFKSWNRPFKFVTEIYYKYLYNLVPYEIDNVRIRYYSDQTAKGYATGIDFKVNGEFVPGIESWASFSVMQSKQDIVGDGHGFVPRPADQRVSLGMFFQDYLPMNPTYKMHLNFLYGSGLPVGPPHTQPYQQTLRLPQYLRVDIGFSKQIKSEDNPLSKRNPFHYFKNIWFSLEVFNLLQANNVVSYMWIKDVENNMYAVPNYLTPRQLNAKLYFDF